MENEILAELKRFDNSLNPFNPSSVVAKVNRNEAVEIDSFFTEVFLRSMEIAEHTNGRFDITVAPLVNLWGFGFENIDKVDARVVDSIRQFVGYRNVWIDGNEVVKADIRAKLNLSAIAKGYSVDVVARLLNRYGISDYMCEIGGEIAMKGKNLRGDCWRDRKAYRRQHRHNERTTSHIASV